MPALASFWEPSRIQSPFLDCVPPEPANTVTDRLNWLLSISGPGFVLRLCPNTRYYIQAPIEFAHPNQEISTAGYPRDDSRATLVVSGAVVNGTGHTVAINGQCSSCGGVKLRNVQVDGNRLDAPIVKDGGANIEMGRDNTNQVIEYVKSSNPRGWSCLHVLEGLEGHPCENATVQNNDIGPCGKDTSEEWADGISLACERSVVRNNVIEDATDGGIVIFGAPGTRVHNNSVTARNQTLLGGINMVDPIPYFDFAGTVVENNTIVGTFADEGHESIQMKGENKYNAFIKIGIAIGPRVWFGDKYMSSRIESGLVVGNRLSGAFGYGIAVTSAFNFTVQNNTLFGNTSFIGLRGPNCTSDDETPPPPHPSSLITTTPLNATFNRKSRLSRTGIHSYVLCPREATTGPFKLAFQIPHRYFHLIRSSRMAL
ncbi:hypothetical protein L218DRAFT_103424 [Marasmius fiardii PR-910]|nr:hypothetical protein L218DRAFT_103424 [Marasmius fiardii PR-910]